MKINKFPPDAITRETSEIIFCGFSENSNTCWSNTQSTDSDGSGKSDNATIASEIFETSGEFNWNLCG